MKTLHIVPEINEANGVYQVARMLARESGDEVIALADVTSANIVGYQEIVIHGMWLPREWFACWKVIRAGKRLVRMTHGSLSPVYLEKQGKWKKRLVAPIERWLFRHTDRVVVTCEAEKRWCQEWGLRNEFEIVDLKRFFDLEGAGEQPKAPLRGTLREYAVSPHSDFRADRLRADTSTFHLLYLGRRHPLKGVEYLERAVEELNQSFELRIVSDHFGEALEKDWDWCDVLVLPTLSENFGLVVAEALERGKRVITTDGAPAWAPPEAVRAKSEVVVEQWRDRIAYLKGFRDGTDEERVRLLKEAIAALV